MAEQTTALTTTARLRQQAVTARDRLRAGTSASQRRWMAVAAGVTMAVMAAVLLWSGREDYRTLYSNLDAREAQQAAAELAAEKVPYELDASGTAIRVPSGSVDKARLGLAAKGLPQSGRMGFELFDKPNWMGSEFDERVNYQRALEGELEHTIGTLGAVDSARVHLVLPKESLFANEAGQAKASVIVRLNRRGLTDAQADAIRNLVAGSVEGLQPGAVNLIDADGRASFHTPSGAAAAAVEEQAVTGRILAVLEPVAGRENLRATVNLDYDTASTVETQDTYDPNAVVAVESHKSESASGAANHAIGVPGTATNAPNTAPAADGKSASTVALPVFPQAVAGSETSREESSSYAASRRTRHMEQGPGRIRRMTIAVLVNDRRVSTGAGKTQKAEWKHRTPEELKHLEELARDAAGFDAARGDQIAVENLPFLEETPAAEPTWMEKVRDRPGPALNSLRPALPLLVLVLLYFMVLRPVTGSLRAALKQPEETSAPATADTPQAAQLTGQTLEADAAEITATAALESPQTERALPAPATPELLAREVRQDPDNAVRLLRNWLALPNPQGSAR